MGFLLRFELRHAPEMEAHLVSTFLSRYTMRGPVGGRHRKNSKSLTYSIFKVEKD